MSPTFFTTSDGDIILRASPESGPKHDFRVHRFILSLASPVFKDMLSFPQPPDQNQNANEPQGIPAVDVPDSPEVLDVILRFIYPGVEPPTFTDLSILSGLLSVADKYNIASMQPVLRGALKTFIPSEPFKAYIIACRFGFMEEVRAAAKASTLRNILSQKDSEEEVRHISSVDLFRLILFVNEREESAREMIMGFASLDIGYYDNPCPIQEHWSGDTADLYKELGRKLVGEFMETPWMQSEDFTWVSEMLFDLPRCQLEPKPFDDNDSDDDDDVECPRQLPFVKIGITTTAWDVNARSDTLLEKAFGKEF